MTVIGEGGLQARRPERATQDYASRHKRGFG